MLTNVFQMEHLSIPEYSIVYSLHFLYLDRVADRRIGLLTQILPSLFHVILLSYAHTRRIKRPKVQPCLFSGSGLRKLLPRFWTQAKMARIEVTTARCQRTG